MAIEFIPKYILEKFRDNLLSGSFEAYTLFADISGFTPMTEKMMTGGNEGAEILSECLKEIFDGINNNIYNRGGFITNFAGDSIIALFPVGNNSAGKSAMVSGLSILKYFKNHTGWKTKLGDFNTKIKIGVSKGKVDWAITGDTLKSFYFKGEGISNCIECYRRAEANSLVCDSTIINDIKPDKISYSEIENGYYKVIESSALDNETVTVPEEMFDLTREIFIRKFLPESVLKSSLQGEFRDVSNLFINISGYKSDAELNETLGMICNSVVKYDGYLKDIDFSDKGCVVPVFFGAPVSHDDNNKRAADLVIEIKEYISSLNNNVSIKAGLTNGKAYAGLIGNEKRAQYSVVGDIVNLSARLMSSVGMNEARTTDKIATKLKDEYSFTNPLKIMPKGFSYRVMTYAVEKKSSGKYESHIGVDFTGRTDELKKLTNIINNSVENSCLEICFINGEQGIGKKRLLNETIKLINKDITSVSVTADKLAGRNYFVFRKLLMNILSGSRNEQNLTRAGFNSGIKEIINNIEEKKNGTNDNNLTQIIKEISRTQSILASLADIFWEGSLFSEIDDSHKRENINYSLINFIHGLAQIKPLTLQINDTQFIDTDSIEIINILANTAKNLPLSILITGTALENGKSISSLFNPGITFQSIELTQLPSADSKKLAESVLEGSIGKSVEELLHSQAGGNPFFVIELITDIKERELLITENEKWELKSGEKINVPESIGAVLLSRFDKLSNEIKYILETASVLGNEIDVKILSGMLTEESFLEDKLNKAEEENIITKLNKLIYMFRHGLLKDTIYEKQLISKLRQLHFAAAEAIKKAYCKKFDVKTYDAYCLHYGVGSGITDIKGNILLNVKAKITDNEVTSVNEFVNLNAELINKYEFELDREYLHKKLELIISLSKIAGDMKTTSEMFLRKAEHEKNRGKYKEANESARKGLEHAEKKGDKNLAGKFYWELGWLSERTGDYKQAMIYFNKSLNCYKSSKNYAGIQQIKGNIGILYYNRGNYKEALRLHNERLKYSKKVNDFKGIAAASGNIGNVYLRQNEFATALKYYNEELTHSKKTNNKVIISNSYGHIGEAYLSQHKFKEAQKFYKKNLQTVLSLGRQREIMRAYGNLAVINMDYLGKFDEALSYFNRYLELSLILNDKKTISILYANIGKLHYLNNEPEKSNEYIDKAIEAAKKQGYNNVILTANRTKLFNSAVLGKINVTEELIAQSIKIAKESGNDEYINYFTVIKKMSAKAKQDNALSIDYLNKLTKELDDELAAEIFYIAYHIMLKQSSNSPTLSILKKAVILRYKKLSKNNPEIEIKKILKELY